MNDFLAKLLASWAPRVVALVLAVAAAALAGLDFTGHAPIPAEAGPKVVGAALVVIALLIEGVRRAFFAEPPAGGPKA